MIVASEAPASAISVIAMAPRPLPALLSGFRIEAFVLTGWENAAFGCARTKRFRSLPEFSQMRVLRRDSAGSFGVPLRSCSRDSHGLTEGVHVGPAQESRLFPGRERPRQQVAHDAIHRMDFFPRSSVRDQPALADYLRMR